MTTIELVFGVALLLAVLTSALAARSPLSTTTVFLAVGLLAGPLVLSLLEVDVGAVEHAAEIALYAILFTDGQHAPLSVLRRRWREPSLALLIAMPLTFAMVTVLAHWVAGLPWAPALVIGAVLAPTDPVFASALVGREDVPRPVRDVLNIESGLNDGLALPVVLALAGMAGGEPEGWSTDPWRLLAEVAMGVGLGVVLPLAVSQVLRLPLVGADERLQPLGPFAIAILLYACCSLTGANQFLAAFVAGSTIATIRPDASEAFRHTGELASELAKGAALLAFATLVDAAVFTDTGWPGLVFAVAVILVARPAPVLVALAGTSIRARERLTVAWFGPKGFASVAYAAIVASGDIGSAGTVLALVTVTVLLSVVAHSSTDVVVASWLAEPPPPGGANLYVP